MISGDNIPGVLIVDDNLSNLKLLSAILRNLDAEIIEAQSGSEALKLTEGKPIALAILDIMMPGINGIELASLLRNQNTESRVPVIFITAQYKEDDELDECYKAGAVDFILKPFRNNVILAKAQVFLELYRQKQKISQQKQFLADMVSELEKSNVVLKDTEKIYRDMLNASPSGIAIMDLSGQITEVSDILLEIFDSENRDEFIGSYFYRMFPPNEKKNIRSIMRTAEKDGLVQNVEFVINRRNNVQVILEVTVTLIQDANGNKKGLMGILRDISQRKKMEQQLIRSERLMSLGEMASAMAHEINQPLLSISLGIENMLLRLKKLNTGDQPYFIEKSERIFNDIARIGRIIDHVRAFSREQHEEVKSLFNVNESISNAISMIAEQFRHHSVNIEIYDDNLPMVKGDTYKFEQVILNLLNNAKDALDEKVRLSGDFEKRITITTWSKYNKIYVKVSDNGNGIRSEDIDRIMLPFFTTKEVGKGTGLGLSISYSIIKELNGNIEVENLPPLPGSTEKSGGTCFVISLPVNE